MLLRIVYRDSISFFRWLMIWWIMLEGTKMAKNNMGRLCYEVSNNWSTTKNNFLQAIPRIRPWKNSDFLHWNFDRKSCFVVFFLEWNEWKNPQFNFSSQNLSIEPNFFKWDGKETKISHLLFHRIWKKTLLYAKSHYVRLHYTSIVDIV